MNRTTPDAGRGDPFVALLRGTWQERRSILRWVLVFLGLGFVLAFALPARYQATVTLDLSGQSPRGGMGMAFLGGMGLGGLLGGDTQAARLVGLISTRRTLEGLFTDPELAPFLLPGKGDKAARHAPSPRQEVPGRDAKAGAHGSDETGSRHGTLPPGTSWRKRPLSGKRVLALGKQIRFKQGERSGLLHLSYERSTGRWFPLLRRWFDEDYHRHVEETISATEKILAGVVANLDETARSLGRATAAREVAFIERRLAESEAELAKSESELAAYKSERGALDPLVGNRAAAATAVQLRSQLVQLRVARRSLEKGLARDHPALLENRARMKAVETELEAMRRHGGSEANPSGLAEGPSGEGFLLPLYATPGAELEFSRLVRTSVIRATVYATLLRQLETTRLMAERESPGFQILDAPAAERSPSGPSRAFVILVFALLGGCFGVSASTVGPLRRELASWLEEASPTDATERTS